MLVGDERPQEFLCLFLVLAEFVCSVEAVLES